MKIKSTQVNEQTAYRERKQAEGKKAKTVWVDDADFKRIKEMASYDKNLTESDFINNMFALAMVRDKMMWGEIVRAKKDGIIPDNVIESYMNYELRRAPPCIEDFFKSFTEVVGDENVACCRIK